MKTKMYKIKNTLLFLLTIISVEANDQDYLNINNQPLYFMNLKNSKINLYKNPDFNSEIIVNLRTQATGSVIKISNADVEQDGFEGHWLHVISRNKNGFVFTSNDVFITTSDLLNSEIPTFNPKYMITLPILFDFTNSQVSEEIQFLPQPNNISLIFLSDDKYKGNIVLKNNITNKYYTFENSIYFKNNSYENKLIFNGVKKTCSTCEEFPVTLLLLKNKIFELNFSFRQSKEYMEWVEGEKSDFNEIKISPDKTIFLYHQEFDFIQRKTPECAEYDVDFYSRCLIKEKKNDYFLAIQNYNQEPIFDYFADTGIPKKYKSIYAKSRLIKEDTK